MNAFILGGTGMVGKHLTRELLASERFSTVTLLSRRELTDSEKETWTNTQKLVIKVVNFDDLQKEVFKGMDIGFCTLGTTRADAGSADAFIKIDHDIPLRAATLFKEQKSDGSFSLLTAAGSNHQSWFLYPQTKGKLEQEMMGLKFKQLSIFRPGLLFLEGEERPKRRFLEGMALSISNFMGNRFGGASISAVGKAMRLMAESPPTEPVRIFENNDILALVQ